MAEDEVISRIRYFLEYNHWSLYRLAKEADIPYGSLSNILQNPVENKGRHLLKYEYSIQLEFRVWGSLFRAIARQNFDGDVMASSRNFNDTMVWNR